jgi:death-on-curing protein
VYGAASSLIDLAAAYGVAIARNHPFIDGNKRVALALIYVFLEMNGVRLEASEKDAVEVMLAIAAGQMDEKELSVWIRKNSVSFLK